MRWTPCDTHEVGPLTRCCIDRTQRCRTKKATSLRGWSRAPSTICFMISPDSLRGGHGKSPCSWRRLRASSCRSCSVSSSCRIEESSGTETCRTRSRYRSIERGRHPASCGTQWPHSAKARYGGSPRVYGRPDRGRPDDGRHMARTRRALSRSLARSPTAPITRGVDGFVTPELFYYLRTGSK